MFGKQGQSATGKQGGLPYRGSKMNTTRTKQLKPLLPNNIKTKTSSFNVTGLNSYSTQKKGCMNDQIFIQRRENHLNTCYNRRKNKLQEIAKKNDQLYKRLNSQKSLYSQKNMNKSTDSFKSNSRCSSRSSTKSLKSKQSKKRALNTNKAKRESTHITIQSENIQKANKANLSQFKSLFMRQKQNEQVRNKQNRSFSLRDKAQNKLDVSSTNPNKTMTNIGLGMGGMLHRIAQQMCQSNNNILKNDGKKKRRMLL